MTTCTACGSNLAPSAQFCAECGTKSGQAANPNESNVPMPALLEQTTPPAIWAESTKSLSTWLHGLLLAAGATGLFLVPGAYDTFKARLDFANGDIKESEAIVRMFERSNSPWAAISGLLSLAIFILFIIWTKKCYSNIRIFGVTKYPKSTGWAVGGWFVPFYNAIVEKGIIDNIWRSSAPGQLDPQWQKREVEKYFTVGWILFFLGLAINTYTSLDAGVSMASGLNSTGFGFSLADIPTRVYFLSLLSSLVTPLGQIAAAIGIRNISKRYETKRREIATSQRISTRHQD